MRRPVSTPDGDLALEGGVVGLSVVPHAPEVCPYPFTVSSRASASSAAIFTEFCSRVAGSVVDRRGPARAAAASATPARRR
jgi:hypothetical protein